MGAGARALAISRCSEKLMAAPTRARGAGSGSSTITWSWPTRVQRPGGDAAVVRVHGTNKALADDLPTARRAIVAADPYEGGKQAVAEAWRNI